MKNKNKYSCLHCQPKMINTTKFSTGGSIAKCEEILRAGWHINAMCACIV